MDFEGRHGNKETFKEMKRIERSVQAEFAQVGIERMTDTIMMVAIVIVMLLKYPLNLHMNMIEFI